MIEKQTVCAIICSAGKGQRAGFGKNKLLVPFEGSNVLTKTLSAFDFPFIDEIVVTVNAEDETEINALCAAFPRAKTVRGGLDRSHSVYNALQATSADIVLIHDGARPFVSREIIENCVQSVKTNGSGICSVACSDTIAVTKNGKIVSVPQRDTLRQIQTPQGFFRENILSAYERAFESDNASYTDDSSVFAQYCGAPYLCEGSRDNIKMTYAEDFEDGYARCGFGIDTHAFGKAQDYIVLAGVKIPSESGLIAHSDGDVLVHAVMDALLSAAGLKDIGHYFPDTDEKWRGASSMEMLKQVLSLLEAEGYGVKNLSVAIQAEKPRLAKYIDDMKNSLSSVLKLDPAYIGISAGTNEGLGYVGEGKGITVNAYALLKKI
ncbi:MAG: 2-C-methyl-D-erythritol 4-phosphate cytidylyltransferase [Clostridia bacterium]|nr:2-C-methyl-D-erythritol 4-phosphate cytidylyltransferase [Clostridia bacterium]